jgi:hypothetical protein
MHVRCSRVFLLFFFFIFFLYFSIPLKYYFFIKYKLSTYSYMFYKIEYRNTIFNERQKDERGEMKEAIEKLKC